VAEKWLDFIRDKVARTTHDRYSDALIRDIYPEYEDTPIEKITFEEITQGKQSGQGSPKKNEACVRGHSPKEADTQGSHSGCTERIHK
jgi:hypothetical protein